MSKPGERILQCPACAAQYAGHCRIGNRKATCRTCNRFAQAVRRAVAARLLKRYPREATRERARVEIEVYSRIIGSTEGGPTP